MNIDILIDGRAGRKDKKLSLGKFKLEAMVPYPDYNVSHFTEILVETMVSSEEKVR